MPAVGFGKWNFQRNPRYLIATFVTSEGRFAFNMLPMGICSASEVFQRTMSGILTGLEGVVCHMDDILVHAADQATHNLRLRLVLERLQEAGLTLNAKCEFFKSSVRFLGHIILANGIHADPEKLKGIHEFPQPKNVTELQRLMGMLNQLDKFTPELTSITAPIRVLQWIPLNCRTFVRGFLRQFTETAN